MYNIFEISRGKGGDCAACYLLDYIYFKSYYKMLTIVLSKQEALNPNFQAIQ